jgi:alkylhydroperoxidase family enzyme
MAWVRTIDPNDADGELLDVYREITGEEHPLRMANVLQSTSLRPRTLRAMMGLNNAVNFTNDDSGVTRLQREMIAAVVSATLECRY